MSPAYPYIQYLALAHLFGHPTIALPKSFTLGHRLRLGRTGLLRSRIARSIPSNAGGGPGKPTKGVLKSPFAGTVTSRNNR